MPVGRLEKPMANSDTECETLQRSAQVGDAYLRVNQNFAHHPALAKGATPQPG